MDHKFNEYLNFPIWKFHFKTCAKIGSYPSLQSPFDFHIYKTETIQQLLKLIQSLKCKKCTANFLPLRKVSEVDKKRERER